MKNVDFTLKLNFASLYTPDNYDQKIAPDLLEKIIMKSKSMHIHYQFSYLPLILQTIYAFTLIQLPLATVATIPSKKKTIDEKETSLTKFNFNFSVLLNDV